MVRSQAFAYARTTSALSPTLRDDYDSNNADGEPEAEPEPEYQVTSPATSATSAAKASPEVLRSIFWVALRAQSELICTLTNTHDMLYRTRGRTEAMLLDDKFEGTLKCIRTDLDAWAAWVQPRVGQSCLVSSRSLLLSQDETDTFSLHIGHDMTAIRLRVEYHYARLYAYGIALDALVRRADRSRLYNSRNTPRHPGEGLLGQPAYPFVVEAISAAQSMIRIMTLELESLRCAPARWFLLLVYAAIFLLKVGDKQR